MKEEINKLKNHLKDCNDRAKRLDDLIDKTICDEHYDVISKQYGCLCDYIEALIERIEFEEEYLSALGLLD